MLTIVFMLNNVLLLNIIEKLHLHIKSVANFSEKNLFLTITAFFQNFSRFSIKTKLKRKVSVFSVLTILFINKLGFFISYN